MSILASLQGIDARILIALQVANGFMSISALAKSLGAGRESVRLSVHRLAENGIVKTKRAARKKRGAVLVCMATRLQVKPKTCAYCARKTNGSKHCPKCKQLARLERTWHKDALMMFASGASPVTISARLKQPLWRGRSDTDEKPMWVDAVVPFLMEVGVLDYSWGTLVKASASSSVGEP